MSPSASKNMSPMAEPQALGLFWWLLLEALAENEGCSMRVKACEKPKDAIILIYMYIYIHIQTCNFLKTQMLIAWYVYFVDRSLVSSLDWAENREDFLDNPGSRAWGAELESAMAWKLNAGTSYLVIQARAPCKSYGFAQQKQGGLLKCCASKHHFDYPPVLFWGISGIPHLWTKP